MLQPVFAGIAPPFETTLARTGRIEGLNPCWEEVLHLATRRDFEKDAVIPHTRWRGMYYPLPRVRRHRLHRRLRPRTADPAGRAGLPLQRGAHGLQL